MVNYNFGLMGKMGSKVRWDKVHSSVRVNKNLSKEKVAIMAYISGDGYIGARKKYFHYDINIALDSLFLTRRVSELFEKEFNVIPKIKRIRPTIKGGTGYYTLRISNKPICLHLLSIGKYGGLNWTIPQRLNKELLTEWIKCYFDCEAYVNLYGKQIQVKSVNRNGLNKVREKLNLFGINCKVYGPYDNGPNHNPYSMLSIYNIKDIIKYRDSIGFYHPNKIIDLQRF